MKHPTLFLAIAATALPMLLNAQGFHRNLPIGHATASCKAATDGGLFAQFFLHPERPLVKLDNAGDVVWAKSIPDISGFVPDPDGGVLLIRPSDGLPQPPGGAYNSLLLQRLNAAGEMVMNRRIVIDDLEGENVDYLKAAAWTPDGQLYLITEASLETQRMMKFDADGELLWSDLSLSYDLEPYNIKVLPDGGALLYLRGSSSSSIGRATRLGPDGAVIWHRHLNTSAPALYETGSSLFVDDDGNLLMAFTAGSIGQPAGTPWVVVGKMDVDANMVWSYAYRRDPGEVMASLEDLSNYLAPARLLPNGNLYFGTVQGFEFTPGGIFVREKICTSPTLAPGFDDITHQFTTVPTADGWLQYGRRRWTDPIFGNFVQMPLLGRTTLELDSTCFWTCDERTDITAVPPPPEIFSPSASNFSVFAETYTTEIWPVDTLADVTMDLFEDACDLPEIVFFQTSVDELDVAATLLLFPNPVVAGQSIQVDADGPLVLEVLDARGRMVASRQQSTQPITLDTAGWDAGLYLLRATRPDGQVLGMGRVVVQ